MALKEQNSKYLGLPDYKKCQFFTPPSVADSMLDIAAVIKPLAEFTFLECSCGEGAILCGAVERYIQTHLGVLGKTELASRLRSQFYGYELDSDKIRICKTNLDSIALRYHLPKIKWNLHCSDFLKAEPRLVFDCIVGNPPYVSYLNLSKETRSQIRETFTTCKNGKFDYCFPFIEKCISLLAPGACLVFITPESIFKTKSASALRRLMLPLLELIDGGLGDGVFPSVQIAPSIFRLKNGCDKNEILYIDKNRQEYRIQKSAVEEFGKWAFFGDDGGAKYRGARPKRTLRFGDCYNVSSSVATLSNKTYLLRRGYLGDRYYFCESGELIEKELVRPAVSPDSRRRGLATFVVYPYEGCLPISEADIASRYPKAYAYLLARKTALQDRSMDKRTNWFEYGRRQSLGLTCSEKYCLSIFVSGRPSLWHCESGTVVFSGIIISQKKQAYPLTLIPSILYSDDFIRYVEAVGIPCSSGSWRITASDLKEYLFDASN